MNADTLLRTMARISDAEIASMLMIAATELAYRRKTGIADVTSLIEGVDPWAPVEDPASHEVRPTLTLAGRVWESMTGRKLLRRRRVH